jgi:hypothetical protein
MFSFKVTTVGFVRRHPHQSGNGAAQGDHGLSLAFDPVDAIRTVEGVAAGRIDEARLADWFRSHIES